MSVYAAAKAHQIPRKTLESRFKTNNDKKGPIPSHSSHYLQPLNRTVFKALQAHFYERCRLRMKQNPGCRITRLSIGTLLLKSWGKAVSVENSMARLKVTGVLIQARFQIMLSHNNQQQLFIIMPAVPTI